MKKLLLTLALLVAVPLSAQQVEVTVQTLIEDGSSDVGARLDVSHEGHAWFHPVASVQYEFGPDDFIAGAGARLAIPGPVGLRWVAARKFAKEGEDVWLGVLSADFRFNDTFGALASWYYTFRDADADNLPERYALGISIR